MLSVSDVTHRFGGIVALDGVSLKVEQGSIHALIGPNGAGKTTLFNIISGFLRPTSGTVRLRDRELTKTTPHAISRLGLARTFQNIRLYQGLTTIENAMLGAYAVGTTSLWEILLAPWRDISGRKRLREAAEKELEFVGLADRNRLEAQATQLPYGDRRRLEIARALLSQPSILLLDEPSAGMNYAEVDALENLIVAIRERGMTVFIIEHNVRLVLSVADRVSVLQFGRKIADDIPTVVRTDPQVVEAYLGTN